MIILFRSEVLCAGFSFISVSYGKQQAELIGNIDLKIYYSDNKLFFTYKTTQFLLFCDTYGPEWSSVVTHFSCRNGLKIALPAYPSRSAVVCPFVCS